MIEKSKKSRKKESVDPIQHAINRALRYLNYRPRSEAEVRGRLERYGYDDNIIEAALNKLRPSGLIDDASFAAYWNENRSSFSPRSTRRLGQELRQKGVNSEIIIAVTKSIDDTDEAYRAGHKKASSLSKTDHNEFRKKMGAFLRYRGFDYDVISTVTEKLWQEKT